MAERAATEQVFVVADGVEPRETPEVMGFKAWNLLRMARIGLPVPSAFVLGTPFCRAWFERGGSLPAGFRDLLAQNVRRIEAESGAGLGSTRRPLLVSVRSGAPVSMPGMLDTVLDVGLCEGVIRGMLRTSGNPRLVWDSYRRLIRSFAHVVCGCDEAPFEAALRECLAREGLARPQDLDFKRLEGLSLRYLDIYRECTGGVFPQDPFEQLEAAVEAVFRSWQSAKAAAYRRMEGIDDALGTAVTVQRMVFGNAGGTSGAGVAFTRNPATGENELYMDYAANAQGEDVVAGRHALAEPDALRELLPQVFEVILAVCAKLEREFGDAQEFEFTVQDGRLYLLQTRSGKRSALAALRIAVEQVREGLIGPAEALARLDALDLESIRDQRIDADPASALCRAVPASAGVASGEIALDCERAVQRAKAGANVILVREDIATEDIAGIQAARGILTGAGGRTSHAAVVARELEKVCLVGCRGLAIDAAGRRLTLGKRRLREGDVITLDGRSGGVFAGEVAASAEAPREYLAEVARWRAAGRAANGNLKDMAHDV
ncbi:MAG: pyruvate, phosphate dikinase [Betaproteobacteria bacterium]|nr:pyruvate, phosphate dikinase [Betaproteobacteria bacterium]